MQWRAYVTPRGDVETGYCPAWQEQQRGFFSNVEGEINSFWTSRSFLWGLYSSEEHLRFLQRTQVRFPAPTSGDSQPSDPDLDPGNTDILLWPSKIPTFIYMNPHINTKVHIKNKPPKIKKFSYDHQMCTMTCKYRHSHSYHTHTHTT